MGYNKAAGDQVSAVEFNSFAASAGLYAASATGNDTYVITVSPVPNDLDVGDKFTFKADVGNTGACTLNVNGLGAKTIKKFVSLDLETGDITAGQIVTVRYDGTNFQMESAARPTPFFEQDLATNAVESLNGPEFYGGSNQDGSAFYCQFQSGGQLYRFQRDTLTGQYVLTHNIDPVFSPGSGDHGVIVVVGSFVYLFFNDGTNIKCVRFAAADLTGETNMTVPVVGSTTHQVAWTDGTFIYVIASGTQTTARKWSISGTTLSAVSTVTCDSALHGSERSSMYDGTTAYIATIGDLPSASAKKLTSIDGSANSSVLFNLIWSLFSDTVSGSFMININTTMCYIGRAYNLENGAATTITTRIRLIPVTKP